MNLAVGLPHLQDGLPRMILRWMELQHSSLLSTKKPTMGSNGFRLGEEVGTEG